MRKHRIGKGHFEPFIKIEIVLLDSAAWKMLTPNARLVYPQWLAAWTPENHHERLVLSAASTSWMMPNLFRAAADRDLVVHGFLDIVDPGGIPARPKVMKLSQRWRKISEEIMANPELGSLRSLWPGAPVLWYPSRRPENPSRLSLLGRSNKERREWEAGDRPVPWKMYNVVPTVHPAKGPKRVPTVHPVDALQGSYGAPRQGSHGAPCEQISDQGAPRPVLVLPPPPPDGLREITKAELMAYRKRRLAGESRDVLREEMIAKKQRVPPAYRNNS